MKTFVKNYIGRGTINQFAIVKLSLNLSEMMKYAVEVNGKMVINIEVATLREKDYFERTHTAYVTTVVESDIQPNTTFESPKPEPAPATSAKPARKRTKALEPA